MYLTTIDKFTKYATIHKLHDRNWISILGALKERIWVLGKMKKLVHDNERCILDNMVTLFLTENSIEAHATTPGIKTGNEHLRILEAEGCENELEDRIFKAILSYNNSIHSTTRIRPIDFIQNNISKE